MARPMKEAADLTSESIPWNPVKLGDQILGVLLQIKLRTHLDHRDRDLGNGVGIRGVDAGQTALKGGTCRLEA